MSITLVFISGLIAATLSLALYEGKKERALTPKETILIVSALFAALMICASLLALWNLTLDILTFTIAVGRIPCNSVTYYDFMFLLGFV